MVVTVLVLVTMICDTWRVWIAMAEVSGGVGSGVGSSIGSRDKLGYLQKNSIS